MRNGELPLARAARKAYAGPMDDELHDALHDTLRRVFGYTSFRGHQRAVI
jgi:superfamily II DNA helicase RecQ